MNTIKKCDRDDNPTEGVSEGFTRSEDVRWSAPEDPPRATVTLKPIPLLLTCPSCGKRHIDHGEFSTKPHHTHACQHCGMCWRPAVVDTVGVEFLPGFKNDDPQDQKDSNDED